MMSQGNTSWKDTKEAVHKDTTTLGSFTWKDHNLCASCTVTSLMVQSVHPEDFLLKNGHLVWNSISRLIRDHSYITYVSIGLGGWVAIAIFAYVQYINHAYIVGGSENVQQTACVIFEWSLMKRSTWKHWKVPNFWPDESLWKRTFVLSCSHWRQRLRNSLWLF